MDEEVKVRYKLKKQMLPSEREEIKEKKRHRNLMILICIVCLLIGIQVGLLIGFGKNAVAPLTGGDGTSLKYDIIKSYFDDLWLYANNYEDLDSTLSEQALHGMTYFEDDPYTTYQSNKEMNDFASSINMNFVGIGVSYTMNDDLPFILRVYKDSPAEKSGLLPGDIMMSVDGIDIRGKETDEIKELVLGEEGTKVTIGINRQGQDLVFEINRGPVDSTVYAYDKEGILVLELLSFGEHSYEECIKYLEPYTNHDKLIIDLRNNTGGYQTAVEKIAGLFLPDKSIVMRVVDKEGNEVNSYVNSNVYYDNFKEIALLINGDTASAAEVLTMALVEQHPNTYTVGETSYGKGVVQSTIQLYDGSAIKLTTSKWLSSKGVWINEVGIKPQYEVLLHDALYEYYWSMEEDETYAYDSVSEFVRIAETGLDYLDYDVKRTDGYFDESFKLALEKFEAKHNLEVDGILDDKTYTAIVSEVTRVYAVDDSKDVQLLKALELIKG